jgi:hypothetical protein
MIGITIFVFSVGIAIASMFLRSKVFCQIGWHRKPYRMYKGFKGKEGNCSVCMVTVKKDTNGMWRE